MDIILKKTELYGKYIYKINADRKTLYDYTQLFVLYNNIFAHKLIPFNMDCVVNYAM